MPFFSVVIPCFNAANTIDDTLQSLQAQTFEDWEAICIDDGSTDLTCEHIRFSAARDERIRLHRNPKKGPSAARNHGALDLAKGDIIAFCDADDLWAPEKLVQLKLAFADRAVDGAFGKIAFFNQNPDDARVTSTVPAEPLSVDTLLGENPVCTMSNVAVRQDRFAASGGFDETIIHNEDLEWLIRLVGTGATIVGLPRTQTFYRCSADGLSADLYAMQVGRERALATAAGLGFHPSAKSHATHQRYLARRALRLGLGRTVALQHAIAGILRSPSGFLSPFRRGVLTFVGALCALFLSPERCRAFFA